MKNNLNSFKKIFQNKKLNEIASKYKKLETEYYNLRFNFFEIVSDKFYYENFHSDILKALLNHKKEFIDNFISILNRKRQEINIDTNNYAKYKAVREEKRIDIFIKDKKSKHSIIIENKINGAIDQKKQLFRYLEKSKQEGYKVDAIVYLTLDGTKEPDFSTYTKDEKKQVEERLIKLSVILDNDETSILSWIENIKKEKEEDTYCFLQQYVKLLKHLKGEIMDYKNMNIFYEQIIKSDFDKAIAFYEMFEKIDKYLIERIYKKIQSEQINISPFKEQNFYDGQEEENLSFYACVFSGYKTISLEITRYWENDFKNKFIIAFFSSEEDIDIKKELNKPDFLDKFTLDTNLKYYGRYYRLFDIKEENSLIECFKNILKSLNK